MIWPKFAIAFGINYDVREIGHKMYLHPSFIDIMTILTNRDNDEYEMITSIKDDEIKTKSLSGKENKTYSKAELALELEKYRLKVLSPVGLLESVGIQYGSMIHSVAYLDGVGQEPAWRIVSSWGGENLQLSRTVKIYNSNLASRTFRYEEVHESIPVHALISGEHRFVVQSQSDFVMNRLLSKGQIIKGSFGIRAIVSTVRDYPISIGEDPNIAISHVSLEDYAENKTSRNSCDSFTVSEFLLGDIQVMQYRIDYNS